MTVQKVYIVSSPSGCGKTTVIDAILKKFDHVGRAITSTTRPPRDGECHGIDYFFLSRSSFREGLQRGDFIESTRRYNHDYGLSRSSIQDIHDEKKDVILNIDWQGMHALRAIYARRLTSFFLWSPSLHSLKDRLVKRGLDAHSVIQQRLDCARSDAQNWYHYDHVLINDNLYETVQEMADIINGASHITNKQKIQNLVSSFEEEDFD